MNKEQVAQVTKQKDPKNVEAGKKGHQTKLLKMKEQILKELSTASHSASPASHSASHTTSLGSHSASPASPASHSASTSTSYDGYMYGIGALSILVITCGVYCYTRLAAQQEQKHHLAAQQEQEQKQHAEHSRVRYKTML